MMWVTSASFSFFMTGISMRIFEKHPKCQSWTFPLESFIVFTGVLWIRLVERLDVLWQHLGWTGRFTSWFLVGWSSTSTEPPPEIPRTVAEVGLNKKGFSLSIWTSLNMIHDVLCRPLGFSRGVPNQCHQQPLQDHTSTNMKVRKNQEWSICSVLHTVFYTCMSQLLQKLGFVFCWCSTLDHGKAPLNPPFARIFLVLFPGIEQANPRQLSPEGRYRGL